MTSTYLTNSHEAAERMVAANPQATIEVLRHVFDYREYYWSNQFGYSINKEFKSKAYGSTGIMVNEKIQSKIELPELLVIATDLGVYLFDPELQVYYD